MNPDFTTLLLTNLQWLPLPIQTSTFPQVDSLRFQPHPVPAEASFHCFAVQQSGKAPLCLPPAPLPLPPIGPTGVGLGVLRLKSSSKVATGSFLLCTDTQT